MSTVTEDIFEIWKALTPDNIKDVSVIMDSMEIFCSLLNEESQISLSMRNVFSNKEYIEELYKTFNQVLYNTLMDLRTDKQFFQQNEIYKKKTNTDLINLDLLKDIQGNTEISTLYQFRQLFEKKGVLSGIDFVFNWIQEYSNELVGDLVIREIQPFILEIEGNLPKSLFDIFVGDIQIPYGFVYNYNDGSDYVTDQDYYWNLSNAFKEVFIGEDYPEWGQFNREFKYVFEKLELSFDGVSNGINFLQDIGWNFETESHEVISVVDYKVKKVYNIGVIDVQSVEENPCRINSYFRLSNGKLLVRIEDGYYNLEGDFVVTNTTIQYYNKFQQLIAEVQNYQNPVLTFSILEEDEKDDEDITATSVRDVIEHKISMQYPTVMDVEDNFKILRTYQEAKNGENTEYETEDIDGNTVTRNIYDGYYDNVDFNDAPDIAFAKVEFLDLDEITAQESLFKPLTYTWHNKKIGEGIFFNNTVNDWRDSLPKPQDDLSSQYFDWYASDSGDAPVKEIVSTEHGDFNVAFRDPKNFKKAFQTPKNTSQTKEFFFSALDYEPWQEFMPLFNQTETKYKNYGMWQRYETRWKYVGQDSGRQVRVGEERLFIDRGVRRYTQMPGYSKDVVMPHYPNYDGHLEDSREYWQVTFDTSNILFVGDPSLSVGDSDLFVGNNITLGQNDEETQYNALQHEKIDESSQNSFGTINNNNYYEHKVGNSYVRNEVYWFELPKKRQGNEQPTFYRGISPRQEEMNYMFFDSEETNSDPVNLQFRTLEYFSIKEI